MTAKTDPGTPSWVLDVAEDTVRYARQSLVDKMLERGEDVTDNALWRQRREQLESLLYSGRVLAVNHSKPLMTTHQGRPVDARDNIPKG